MLKEKKLEWTRHSRAKMRFYGLSEQRVKRVLHTPKRIEEGVAEDREEPRPAVGAGIELVEVLEGPQVRFLREVLRLRPVPGEAQGEVEDPVQVDQRLVLEFLAARLAPHVSSPRRTIRRDCLFPAVGRQHIMGGTMNWGAV